MLPIVALLALADAQPLPSPPEVPWPSTPAGAIIATPDWSDYRIYPVAALKSNHEGRVAAQVLVGADGRPQTCRILSSSYFPDLDQGSCDLMMQMRFEPARDAAGTAIPSQFARRINWRLTDPQPYASSSVSARLTVADGKTQQCAVERAEGAYVEYWSSIACGVFRDARYYLGDYSERVVTAEIEVRLDAGDDAPLLAEPWPMGSPVAAQKQTFTISPIGDPSDCNTVEEHGFGPRGLNNLSRCARLLAALWLVGPQAGAPPRKGTFETRVYIDRR